MYNIASLSTAHNAKECSCAIWLQERPNNLLFQPRIPCNPQYTGASPWSQEPSVEHEGYILLEVRQKEFVGPTLIVPRDLKPKHYLKHVNDYTMQIIN